MTIKAQLIEDMKQAMRAHDSRRLETIRYLLSQIKNTEIDRGELTDEQVIEILQRELKRRKEAIEQFRKGSRDELADEEEAKLTVLAEYLPAMLSEAEVLSIIEKIMEDTTDYGQIMREAMKQLRGKAEGQLVSKVVKRLVGTIE